jgi:calcium/calmodulin-dependent protein kinase I
MLHLSDVPAQGHSKKQNYTFHKVIGRGGYSEVRRATWNGEGCSKSPMGTVEVAVKVVDKTVIHDRQNYLKILSTQQRMQHPVVINLLDWFESTTKYYVTFELLDGELFDYLVIQPYSEQEAIQVIRGVLDLLIYCREPPV